MPAINFKKRRRFTTCYRRSQVQVIAKYNVGMLFGAVALTGKQILAFIPNFQIVIFGLMMVATVMATTVMWVTINSFCWLNVLFNGLALGSITYFFIFNLFGLFGIITRRLVLKSWGWAAVFWFVLGYLFGLLYAVEIWLLLGWAAAIGYWLAGVWFDTVNAFSDVFFVLVLFQPMLTFFSNQHCQRMSYLFNPVFLHYITG